MKTSRLSVHMASCGSAILRLVVNAGWFECVRGELEHADLVKRSAERRSQCADLVLSQMVHLQVEHQMG